jgi:hypothetical protein
MKPIFTICFLLVLSVSCKKAVQKVQEDLVIQAMTDGQWAVTSFTEDGNNITASFAGYKFQYYANRTVDAIKNGTVEKTGTWDGDATTMTTWASFTNAGNPLSQVNGAWQILRSGWTYVEAKQIVNGITKIMRLDKV